MAADRLEILSAAELDRTLHRLASQVLESLADSRQLLVLGIPTRGVALAEVLARRLEQGGVKLYLSGLKKQVLEVLERAEIHKTLPPERIFRTKEQALKTLLEKYG